MSGDRTPGQSGGRGPGQRAGLTRERVLAAARELLAERGFDALTMRALADRLGVSPNTIYSHVEDKTDLVDALLDDVLAGVQAPSADAVDPIDGLHAIMASTFEVLLAHPDLVPLYVARQGARGPNANRLGDVMIALLERAGVKGSAARDARNVLIVYTIGFAGFAARPPFDQGERPLAPAKAGANFESGLRWLLAGIAVKARGRARRAPA